MRAIVIRESLTSNVLPEPLSSNVVREYGHHLDKQTPITIIESEVEVAAADGVALTLSRLMKPELFYAHLVDDERMLIAFPRAVVEIRRDHEEDELNAQRVGQMFSIPVHQMQFLAMFENDHPDAPGQA